MIVTATVRDMLPAIRMPRTGRWRASSGIGRPDARSLGSRQPRSEVDRPPRVNLGVAVTPDLHSGPLRQSADPAIGHGAVLVFERLLSAARQREVCKE